MAETAGLKLVSLLLQGLMVGERLTPLFSRVANFAKDYEDPDRPDVTLEALDAELEAMRARSRRIQDAGQP